ncbi:hypothetical protein SUGI_0683090 [Cryptomeria japonica]|nr:hypothetical protein SUGI_0683090 [Cryptomeria japonica]
MNNEKDELEDIGPIALNDLPGLLNCRENMKEMPEDRSHKLYSRFRGRYIWMKRKECQEVQHKYTSPFWITFVRAKRNGTSQDLIPAFSWIHCVGFNQWGIDSPSMHLLVKIVSTYRTIEVKTVPQYL